MNSYRKAWEIAAYTYRAEILCPSCVIDALPTGPDQEFDGWAVAPGARMSTEDNLSEIAYAFGIDREDESSFDSDEFPKIVFLSSLEDSEQCGRCGSEL